MADETNDTPATVPMKALQLHTYKGHEYDVGDTYDADEGDVATIEVQGKAARADAAADNEAAPPTRGTDHHKKK